MSSFFHRRRKPRVDPLGDLDTNAAHRIERILSENIIPFWYPGCIDNEHGGYRLNHAATGDWQGPSRKYLVSQSRMIWFFARLSRTSLGNADYMAAARHGVDFLLEKMHDSESGGYFWEVESCGVLKGGRDQLANDNTTAYKHLYGQAFALYALSEFAMVADEPGPENAARALFEMIETAAHDRTWGGYREFFTRDWKDTEHAESPFLGHYPSSLKTRNSHLHLIEALSSYVRLTGDDVAKIRLNELILIIIGPFYLERYGTFANACTRDWQVVLEHGFDACSYGHDLETIWLLEDSCVVAGVSSQRLTERLERVFHHAFRNGFDRRQGGFYFGGPFGKRARNKDKVFWVQAEALLCCLRRFQTTKNAIYAMCFNKTLDWIETFQTDWQRGDWHNTIKPSGRVVGLKAGPWKAAYHNGRAMIECLERLRA